MEGPAGAADRRGEFSHPPFVPLYRTSYLTTFSPIQGTGDNFYKQKQLLPENFIAAAKEAGNDKGINLRMQPDYDHSYYFMATFADEHVEWAAKHLFA